MLDLKRLAEFGVASSGNSFGFATEAQDSGEGGWSGNDPVGSWGREWWGPLQFLYFQKGEGALAYLYQHPTLQVSC